MNFHPSLNAVAQMIPFGIGGAVKNGVNINLALVHRAFVCVIVEEGAANTTPTFTLGQSTVGAGTTAGTNEKAMTAECPVWYNEDCSLDNLMTEGVTTAGAFTVTGAGQSRTKMYIFEVIPDIHMDVANRFDVLVVNTTDPVATAILGAFAILEPRYGPLPTVYTDY